MDQLSFSLIHCQEEDQKRISRHLEELREMVSAADKRSKFSDSNTETYGILSGFSKFEWSLLKIT